MQATTAHRVQECGCISIPEGMVERTGLRPGAAYRFSFHSEDTGLLIVAEDASGPVTPLLAGTTCG